jgi:hypothetical protein
MGTGAVRFLIGLGAVVGLLAMTTELAAAAPASRPPTLAGEVFAAQGGMSPGGLCQHAGQFSLTVSGTAAGPYPGTFTESIQGTVQGPEQNSEPVTLQSYHATFTITSPTGNVSGTEWMPGPPPAVCFQDPTNYGLLNPVPMDYVASVGPNGKYLDRGTTITYVSAGPHNYYLSDQLSSSQSQLALELPSSPQQCENGGWQPYTVFGNQAACLTFVADGGWK